MKNIFQIEVTSLYELEIDAPSYEEAWDIADNMSDKEIMNELDAPTSYEVTQINWTGDKE